MTTIVILAIVGLTALLLVGFKFRKIIKNAIKEKIWQVMTFYVANRLWIRAYVVQDWNGRKAEFKKMAKTIFTVTAVAATVVGVIVGIYHLRQPRKMLVKVSEMSEVVHLEDIISISRVDGRTYVYLDENKNILEGPYAYPVGTELNWPEGADMIQFGAEVRQYYVTLRGPLGSKPNYKPRGEPPPPQQG